MVGESGSGKTTLLNLFTGADAAVAADCRFNDCRHEGEPGCAVEAAAEAGTLAPARLTQYVRLRHKAEVNERRRSVPEQRAHDRAFGRMIHDALRQKHRASAPRMHP